eukprot:TRINITY_DN59767_c0_g1_i2.p1 TRINITY_DN59767_c0_g1~~TRINITY_DN59767_c0_g1_i2.p1  ORF type:complete len:354 (-),score=52.49 TRINITY_DN59767_c0_g1_i2:80-1141(-)
MKAAMDEKGSMQTRLGEEISHWKNLAETRKASQETLVNDLEGKLKVEEHILTTLKKEACIECVPTAQDTAADSRAKVLLSRAKFGNTPNRETVQKEWSNSGHTTMIMESEQNATEWCSTPLALTHFDIRLVVVAGALEFDFPETREHATVSVGDELFVPARVRYALKCKDGTAPCRIWLTYGGGVLGALAVSSSKSTTQTVPHKSTESQVGVNVTVGDLEGLKAKDGELDLKFQLKCGYSDFSTSGKNTAKASWDESFPFTLATHTLLTLVLNNGSNQLGKAEVDCSELPMHVGRSVQSVPVKDSKGAQIATVSLSFEPKQNMWLWRQTGHKTLSTPTIHTGYSFHPASSKNR